MKKPEDAAREVFGARASKYAQSACHSDPENLATIVGLASPAPHWRVLDVGTGTAHTALAIAPHVRHVAATDITPEMLSQAEKLKVKQSISNVSFVLADAHRLPFKGGSFELITCRRAAHHFSNVLQVLQEMREALCPGGSLLIDDRSVPEDDFVDKCMNELDRYHDESHVRQYRLSEWEEMLAQAGLRVEATSSYVKHRPLSSLTEGVCRTKVERIHATLEKLDSFQRRALNFAEVDGVPHINHWYVIILATKG